MGGGISGEVFVQHLLLAKDRDMPGVIVRVPQLGWRLLWLTRLVTGQLLYCTWYTRCEVCHTEGINESSIPTIRDQKEWICPGLHAAFVNTAQKPCLAINILFAKIKEWLLCITYFFHHCQGLAAAAADVDICTSVDRLYWYWCHPFSGKRRCRVYLWLYWSWPQLECIWGFV